MNSRSTQVTVILGKNMAPMKHTELPTGSIHIGTEVTEALFTNTNDSFPVSTLLKKRNVLAQSIYEDAELQSLICHTRSMSPPIQLHNDKIAHASPNMSNVCDRKMSCLHLAECAGIRQKSASVDHLDCLYQLLVDYSKRNKLKLKSIKSFDHLTPSFGSVSNKSENLDREEQFVRGRHPLENNVPQSTNETGNVVPKHLVLPGYLNFENDLIREIAYFELCEFLIDQIEEFKQSDDFGMDLSSFNSETPNQIKDLEKTNFDLVSTEISLFWSQIANFSNSTLNPAKAFVESPPSNTMIVSVHRNKAVQMALSVINFGLKLLTSSLDQSYFVFKLVDLKRFLLTTCDLDWGFRLFQSSSIGAPTTTITVKADDKLSWRAKLAIRGRSCSKIDLSCDYRSQTNVDDHLSNANCPLIINDDHQDADGMSCNLGFRFPILAHSRWSYFEQMDYRLISRALLINLPIPKSKRKSILLSQQSRCAGCGLFVESSSLISSWNFQAFPVSNLARDILVKLNYQPLFYNFEFPKYILQRQSNLIECAKLRRQGHLMFPYVQWCPEGQIFVDDLKQTHWFELPHVWSIADLHAVRDGKLVTQLRLILHPIQTHLASCIRCRGEGFICEICHSGEVLFPFDQLDSISCCFTCLACYHRQCLPQPKADTCPRCIRRSAKRRQKLKLR